MRDVLHSVVDADSFEECKAQYEQSLVTATARVGGRSFALVANQRASTKTGEGEVHIGGVIYGDAADKAARFVLNADQKQLPIVFFQDVTGFMVGTRAEHGGIIKDGAKLVRAVSNCRVPKITVVMGNSYGAGNYALCGRAFGPRFMVAWPTARIAVMGGAQAAQTIHSVQSARVVEGVDSGQSEEALERIRASYEETASPYYATARLWVDAVIDPAATRDVLDHLLAIVCRGEGA